MLTSDIELIGKTLRDVIIEPQRAAAVPCFDVVKAAAEKRGALGCSLSGSGPSMFALCETGDARNIAMAMEQACRTQGIGCQSWVSPMTAPGARIERTLMKYFSTRGAGPVTLDDALRQGIASDGGLFLPEQLPSLRCRQTSDGAETIPEVAAGLA